jgi:thiol:disulfide interchange protein
MLSVLGEILDLFLVLGKSKWGWLGLAGGLASAFAAWLVVESQPERSICSAVAFLVAFMALAWQELGKRKDRLRG